MTESVEKVLWRPRGYVWATWAGTTVSFGVMVWMLSYINSYGSWAVVGWIVSLPVWLLAGIGASLLAAFLSFGRQGKCAGGWTLVVLGVLGSLLIPGMIH